MSVNRLPAAVFATGVLGALLLVPGTASAQTIAATSACLNTGGVAANARGGYSDVDTRSVTPDEQRQIEDQTAQIVSSQGRAGAKSAAGDITIPVYVHEMLGSNGEGDVTDAQVNAQIDVLNQTYSGHDVDGHSNVDTGFRFYLAGHDTYYNDNWHVDKASRHYRSLTREGGRDALNIWVVATDYLGIATFPWDYSTAPGVDGVRVQWGSLPGGWIPNYNQGETATHEVGHWLGLYHTFQGGCNDPGDEVADTPAEATPSAGCPEGKDTCPAPGTDPVHNYMDYSYDSCYYTFSQGQADRMHTMWQAYRGPLS